MTGFLDLVKKNVKSECRIVLPEGTEEPIIKAAARARDEQVCRPVLLGDCEQIRRMSSVAGVKLGEIDVIAPRESPKLEEYASAYRDATGTQEEAAKKTVEKPLYYGAMMVRQGDADAMVVGISPKKVGTGEVIRAALSVIGLEEGISRASSFFVMEVPGWVRDEGLLVFADGGVNPDPTPEQLADIAIATAENSRALLGWQPRVAMLSFSTKGSAKHSLVEKMIRATDIAKARAPELLVDGELQADAALIPEVAARKVKSPSPVAGKANVLIFPNLDAANIAYKLVQRLAGARAYGPILQGFAKPVSDLSRGATEEDVFGIVAIVSAMVRR